MVSSSFSFFSSSSSSFFIRCSIHRLWLCAFVIFIPHSTLFIHFPFRHLMMDHLKLFFFTRSTFAIVVSVFSASFYGNCKCILFVFVFHRYHTTQFTKLKTIFTLKLAILKIIENENYIFMEVIS